MSQSNFFGGSQKDILNGVLSIGRFFFLDITSIDTHQTVTTDSRLLVLLIQELLYQQGENT